jgi:AcrR family transcriptional regulator
MAYRRSPAAAARKLARRSTLLDAAMRLFGSYGYHAATVPMIVAEAGSSVGSFYAHFRNKEDVFAAVLEELGEKVNRVIQQGKQSVPDPLSGIPAAVEALFLFLVENPQQARILIVESSGLSPRLEMVRRGNLNQIAEQVSHSLEMASASLFVANPAMAARCLVGAVYESLRFWREEPPAERLPALEAARAVADYNSRALRRD